MVIILLSIGFSITELYIIPPDKSPYSQQVNKNPNWLDYPFPIQLMNNPQAKFGSQICDGLFRNISLGKDPFETVLSGNISNP